MTSTTKVNSRFSVLHENLSKALGIVNKFVENKPSLPVLANILLEAEGSRLRVAATDLQSTIVMWIGCKTDVPGEITVPAKTFTELVGKLSRERIDMVIDDDTHTVAMKCGASTANVKGITADEYPPINEEIDAADISHQFDIDGWQLKNLIKNTQFAAATENNRPILTGICFQLMPHSITTAAADGYRLAIHKEDVDTGVTEADSNGPIAQNYVIPAVPLKNLEKMIDEGDSVRVAFSVNRGVVCFNLPNITVMMQLHEGRYPDFNMIVPQQFETEVMVYTEDMVTMIDRARVFAKDSANSGHFYIKPPARPNEPGEVQIVGKSAERGDTDGVIDAAIKGEPMDISTNLIYLKEALGIVQEERSCLMLNGAESPIVIKTETADYPLCVVMPMSR